MDKPLGKKQKKAYDPPKVSVYGTVQQLTLGRNNKNNHESHQRLVGT